MKLRNLKQFEISRVEQSKINAGVASMEDELIHTVIPTYNPTTGQTHLIQCFGEASCNAAINFWAHEGYVHVSNDPMYTVKKT
ncbi:hypothetical protein [Flavobacterium sp.]|jgi:hypothetical protein|uniref:hypothetical protein n=1 Tax=Flavobacterium sp. TaxID=239 RepID=UPI0037BFE33A